MGRNEARAIVDELIAGCSSGAGIDEIPVTDTLRCWTPLADWQRGDAALAALRRVVQRFCGPGPVVAQPSLIISDGAHIVVEVAPPGEAGGPSASVTLLIVTSGGLVNEVRCYVDPRADWLRGVDT